MFDLLKRLWSSRRRTRRWKTTKTLLLILEFFPHFLARTSCISSDIMYWTTHFYILPFYFDFSLLNVNIRTKIS